MFSAHVKFLFDRIHGVLSGIDPRFTVKDIEAAAQRDNFVHKCDSLMSYGAPRSLFVLVADSLLTSGNNNPDGEEGSARQSAGGHQLASPGAGGPNSSALLDGIMFTTRVSSMVGIAKVVYCCRMGEDDVESFGSRNFSAATKNDAHAHGQSGSLMHTPEQPDLLGNRSKTNSTVSSRNNHLSSGNLTTSNKHYIPEASLLQELIVGVVDNNVNDTFLDLTRDLLLPLLSLRHTQTVKTIRYDPLAPQNIASAEDGDGENGPEDDSSAGEEKHGKHDADGNSKALGQRGGRPFTGITEENTKVGYTLDIDGVENMFTKFMHNVENRMNAFEDLSKHSSSSTVPTITLEDAQTVVKEVQCSPNGYMKAAQNALLSQSISSIFEEWCTAVEGSNSKDKCSGFLSLSTTSSKQRVALGNSSITAEAAAMKQDLYTNNGKIESVAEVVANRNAKLMAEKNKDGGATAGGAGGGTGGEDGPLLEEVFDFQLVDEDYGPLAEIKAWKNFYIKSRSTLELAESHEATSLFHVLELFDPDLADRWTKCKEDLRAAAEQANSVHKYLCTIEHVFLPLYSRSPEKVGACVAELIEAIKLLQTVVPYYQNEQHITLLFVCCSNQIVLTCKDAIRKPCRVWEQADSIPLLKQMLHHFAATASAARGFRHEFVSHGFDNLSELPIFGKLELFCTRLRKMNDLFDTVLTFRILNEYSLEGIESLLQQFFGNFDDLRRKSGDPLDYTKPGFDRDFFDFRKKIVETDCSLQVYVNSQFESVPNVLSALELLKKFSILMQRESIRGDLQAKYLMLFQRYGTDVESVQRIYEHEKGAPPLPRNAPPVAGRILWARQLLSRIVAPMQAFQESKALVAHPRETSKINRLYNRVALALTEFEAHWVKAWREMVHSIVSNGLEATLLVTDPDTQALIVNFDENISELVREAKWLARVGIDIPEEAANLTKYRNLLTIVNQLIYLVHHYERTTNKVPAVLRGAMQEQFDATYRAILPGLKTIKWSSAKLKTYIQNVMNVVTNLENLVDKVNSITENRIHVHLRDTMREPLIISSEELQRVGPLGLEEFWQLQQETATRAKNRFSVINDTMREGVEDLCKALESGWSPQNAETEASKIYQHYNRQLFKSVLASTNNAFVALRQHIGQELRLGGFIHIQHPFLKLSLDLSVPHVIVTPSLEDVQDIVNRAITSILQCSQSIGAWPYVRSAYSAEILDTPVSFYEEVSRNKEVVKSILLLTGNVFGLRKLLDEFLTSFTRFSYLWTRDFRQSIKTFASKNRPLEHYEEELNGCKAIADEVNLMQDISMVGCLSVDCIPIKDSINKQIVLWKNQYGKALGSKVEEKLTFVYDKVETIMKKALQPTTDDYTIMKDQLDTLQEAHHWEWLSETELRPLEDICTVMETHQVQSPSEYMDRIFDLRAKWKRLRKVASTKKEEISKIQHCYKQELITSVNMFSVEIQCFYNDYVQNGPSVKSLSPMEAIERLKRFQRVLNDKLRHWQIHVGAEEVFGYKPHQYPELAFITKEVASLDKLYTLFLSVTGKLNTFTATLWKDLDTKTFLEEITKMQESVKRLPPTVKQWPAYVSLKKLVEDYVELFPVVEQLNHPSIRERHWRDVMKICDKTWSLDREIMTLQVLVDANLLPFRDEIVDLAMASEKEGEIENKLHTVTREWKEKELSFAEFKHRGFITLKGDDTAALKEQLEETLVTLGSVIGSRYVAPFRAEAHSWSVKITTIAETLALWVEVQAHWMYLEAVFAGGDIMKQLPQEAKRFAMIDKQWVKIFFKATEVMNVVDFCFGNELLKSLPYLKEQLECCQRALASYLEQKRNAFARFFFVSDTVLLEVLSQGSDPHAVQPHLSAIFDGIYQVAFDAKDKKRDSIGIKSISSFEGETIPLVENVKCEGNIETWLQALCDEMQRSVRMTMREAVNELMAVKSTMPLLQKYLYAHPSQVVITALQISYTGDVNHALEGKQADRRELTKYLVSLKELLADQVRMEISKRHQTHIETLTTMAVHNQDVWEQSVKKQAKDAQSFEWQKQLRFQWTERDRCMLHIADADILYCDEYLGVKERLVITPLTDRCYITLSQALAMYMGGAPAGPAGTGKTETVKDLGRAAGKYVVVFNCSDQWDFRSLGKIFKGLAQSGAWGCFDEFNRITLPVLSVVAQQIHCIFLAQKQHRNEFTFTDGSHCKLQPGVGVFVTMNPGYAGRQELPENLKILFRGVSMMVPDRQAIMKVKLAACGYKQDALLARKFNMLYQMCEQQLSATRHYDFGLRNILSVLRTAGSVLRRMGGKDEELVFMRCVRDMNLSKLIFTDVPVFLSLLEDIFQGKKPENATYDKLEEALKRKAMDTNTGATPAWINKCVQIYETKLVRHGIMVVGPAGSGKTVCLNHLLHALHITERKHKEVRMNPKAITAQQMFGQMDVATGDWFDGVFSYLWRRYNKERSISVWLVCDGPVDTLWVESLNTVLDDNKLLTLANGDRILMSPTLKMCFEVENLNNASPATVSRAGIVFISLEDVGWEAVYESAVANEVSSKAWNNAIGSVFVRLGKENIEAFMKILRTEAKSYMGLSPQQLSRTLVSIAKPLGEELCKTPGKSQTTAEMIFWYSFAWALGGSLDSSDREMLLQHFTKKVPKLSGHNIFECYVSVATGDWESWTALVPKWDHEFDKNSAHINIANIFIPTIESTVLHSILNTHQQQGQPALLVGIAGSAKTITMQRFLQDSATDATIWAKTNISRATTPQMVQTTLEDVCEKRMGATYGPKRNKLMSFFIDDINMSDTNEWGDQIVCELLRQVVEFDGLYSLDKVGEWKHFVDIKFFAAMSISTTSKNTSSIPNRLLRHFGVYNLPFPSTFALETIYGGILRSRFGNVSSLVSTLDEIVSATLELWQKCQLKLLPTPTRFHYAFNLRDLSRIVQGMLLTPIDTVAHPRPLLELWAHECSRVLSDKLNFTSDVDWFRQTLKEVSQSKFGMDAPREQHLFCNFTRDPIVDEYGEEVEAPRVYEKVPFTSVQEKLYHMLSRHNDTKKTVKLDLVLFEVAVQHVLRIARVISTPRGSVLMVGVGGSGKQSLTRLASYTQGHSLFQPTVTSHYNLTNWFDDLRSQYVAAGATPVTFLVTDADLKSESYLEYINASLSGGDVPGLFNADEKDQARTGIRPIAKQLAKREFEDSEEWLWSFFLERVRDNLHYVICFSPQGDKFRSRVRQFPGIIAACTINYFFPWPQDALLEVAEKVLSEVQISNTDRVRKDLPLLAATIHTSIRDLCEDYFVRYRQSVHTTPKLFLTFLQQFVSVYQSKNDELTREIEALGGGLEKLRQAGDDVAAMKVELGKKEEKLEVARSETEALLRDITETTKQAERQKQEVATVTEALSKDAAEIAAAREEAEADLVAAQPAVEAAKRALEAITANDIKTLKAMQRPPEMVRRIFDGVCILLHEHVDEVRTEQGKGGKMIMGDSWVSNGRAVCSRSELLDQLNAFNTKKKDEVNDETCELLLPYIQQEDFTFERAKTACGNVAGLCTWVRAMVTYREISKFVAPKIVKLNLAEGQLRRANKKLNKQKEELAKAEEELRECQARLNEAMARKQELEDDANRTFRKVTYATELIHALDEERKRWRVQQGESADTMEKLVGNALCAAAFIVYGCPLNTEFRKLLFSDYLVATCKKVKMPMSNNLQFTKFMVDDQTVTGWQIEGLPMDEHSIENAIIVIHGLKTPFLVDPQEQGANWIAERNTEKHLATIRLEEKGMMGKIETQLLEGQPLLITDVKFGREPVLDSLLNKNIQRTGRQLLINILGDLYDYHEDFEMTLTTKLSQMTFEPEVYAKVSVIDFGVTLSGLEQQLQARVIASEKAVLEEQMNELIRSINDDERSLKLLEEELLKKLSSVEGSLVDDESLVLHLKKSKASAIEIGQKIVTASETRKKIRIARDEYSPVAARGAILYFVAVEMASINQAYQMSLTQMTALFDEGLKKSATSSNTAIRVRSISELVTQLFFVFVGRGLFENHKLLFSLLIACKIQIANGTITTEAFRNFLRSGGALDYEDVIRQRPKTFGWLSPAQWKNLVSLLDVPKLKHVIEAIAHNEADWVALNNHPAPESVTAIPGMSELLPFDKMMVIRALREDRTLAAAAIYIKEVLGDKFVDVPAYDLEDIVQEVQGRMPILFLLSPGSDPTQILEQHSKKRHKQLFHVSLGQGQEGAAMALLEQGVQQGLWIVFQNCHLGIPFLHHMQQWTQQVPVGAKCTDHEDFRVFMTCEPTADFPVSLMQRCLKLTNEPTQGMSASMKKAASWLNQDSYEMFRRAEWKPMMFALCYYHSLLLERKKYGSQGWTVSYQFSEGDFHASLVFLQNYIGSIGDHAKRNSSVAWDGIRFMIGDIQYGGRVTNSNDRTTLQAITEKIFSPHLCDKHHFMCPELGKFPVAEAQDVVQYRALIAPMFTMNEPPQVVGLHQNAEVTHRARQSELVLTTILNVQPRQAASSGGVTRESVVLEIIDQTLNKLPKPFSTRYLKETAERLNPVKPLTIFFGLEAERLSNLIRVIQSTLQDLKLALNGTVALTPQLSAVSDSLFFSTVPAMFVPFSWNNKGFVVWLHNLHKRYDLIKGFLQAGSLTVYQLSCFYNPRGFLNSVRQEICRKHAPEGWILDKVETKFHATKFTEETDVDSGPEEGVFISGLFLDGAAWDVQRMKLKQSTPKDLFPRMPLIHVTAVQVSGKGSGAGAAAGGPSSPGGATSTMMDPTMMGSGDIGTSMAAGPGGPAPPSALPPGGMFMRSKANKNDEGIRKLTTIPCYVNPSRGDTGFVCDIELFHDDPDPLSWILRGVALLCNTE